MCTYVDRDGFKSGHAAVANRSVTRTHSCNVTVHVHACLQLLSTLKCLFILQDSNLVDIDIDLRDCPPGYRLRPWSIDIYDDCACNTERGEIADCDGRQISMIVRECVLFSCSVNII